MSLVLTLGLISTMAWAATMEMKTFYPPPASTLPDPFHVNHRMTVGRSYLNTTPPDDSALIEGSLGIRTTTPNAPLGIGPTSGPPPPEADGGSIRWEGAGSNRYFQIDNTSGDLRVATQDATDDSQKIRVRNSGSVEILLPGSPPVTPTAIIDVGPSGGTDQGGEVRWLGEGSNRYFYIDNLAGNLRLVTQDDDDGNTNTVDESQKLTMTNVGDVGVWMAGSNPSPFAPLTIGPTSVSNEGAEFRLLGAASNRYFYIENQSGNMRIVTQDSSSTESAKFVVTQAGNVGINETVPAQRLHVKNGGAFNGPTAIGLTTAKTALHIKGKFLTQGPPGTETQYRFEATGGKLHIGEVSGANESLIVISSDNVGIKLTNPLYALDVSGLSFLGGKGETYVPPNRPVVFGSVQQPSSMPANTIVYVTGSGHATGTLSGSSSSVHKKKDIVPLSHEDEQFLQAKLTRLPVYRYRFKTKDPLKKHHIGIISEEAPEEIVDEHRLGLEMGDYLATLLATLKAQHGQIEVLEMEMKQLELENLKMGVGFQEDAREAHLESS